jgi:hypothetical protein
MIKSELTLKLLGFFWLIHSIGLFSVDTSFLTFLTALILGVRIFVRTLSKRPRHWVLPILISYLCVICLFGSIYHFAFKFKPDAFSFSSAIQEGKALGTFEKDFKNLTVLNREIFALGVIQSFTKEAYSATKNELITYYEPPSKDLIDERMVSLADKFEVVFNHQRGDNGVYVKRIYLRGVNRGDIVITGHISFTNINTVGITNLVKSESETDFKLKLNAFIEEKQTQRSNMITILDQNTLNLPEWGLVDFLYFSAVTTTTLGYGDILPNSTLVRVLVMLNTIVGIFVLGFLVYLFKADDS